MNRHVTPGESESAKKPASLPLRGRSLQLKLLCSLHRIVAALEVTESRTYTSRTWRGEILALAAPLTLTVAVDNLLDETYRDFLDTYKGYALSPGRDVQFSLSTSF